MSETVGMKESTRIALRKKCMRDFYSFCVAVMGYDDITEALHGEYCSFLEGPETRKQVTLPRSFVKTWIGTIAYSVWIALPRREADEFPAGIDPNDKFYNLGPNIRILIASYVIGNAMKMIGLIRKTYERNATMQMLFPDVIPENFNKIKWSDQEACIQRSEDFTEATFEAGGIGGSTTSRHYDLIIEDDLIYANKDDFTGKELQPSQEDIDKAIGWHKLAMSLLVPGKHTRIHNIGTRWAKKDLVDYIRTNEPDYVRFERAATKEGTWPGTPVWPEVYDVAQLQRIKDAQGPYMFSTQYLCKPIAPEDMLFRKDWLQYYRAANDVPRDIRIFTTVDLSLWKKTVRKVGASRAVILTCGWDSKNHIWILHYNVGRFNPSQVIDYIYLHQQNFRPEVIGVEAVYYQQALMHFLRLEMEKPTRGRLPVRELVTSTSINKDVRIRVIEPYASGLAVHCRPEHEDFINEWCDYVPGSDVCTKDILDALAYQFQIARPGDAAVLVPDRRERYADFKFPGFPVDGVMEEMWRNFEGRTTSRGPFKEYEIPTRDAQYSEDKREAEGFLLWDEIEQGLHEP